MKLDTTQPMVMHLIPRPNGIKKGADQLLSIYYQLSALHVMSAVHLILILSSLLLSYSHLSIPLLLTLLLTADTDTISEVGTARKISMPVLATVVVSLRSALSCELLSLSPSLTRHARLALCFSAGDVPPGTITVPLTPGFTIHSCCAFERHNIMEVRTPTHPCCCCCIGFSICPPLLCTHTAVLVLDASLQN